MPLQNGDVAASLAVAQVQAHRGGVALRWGRRVHVRGGHATRPHGAQSSEQEVSADTLPAHDRADKHSERGEVARQHLATASADESDQFAILPGPDEALVSR